MKYKKKILSAVFLLLGLGGLYAQETVPTSGGDASGSGGSASYTIGQVVYSVNAGATGSLVQGVQQPFEISNLVGIEFEEINLELVAYPNPTQNALFLTIGTYNNEKLTYQLYDMQGKLLDSKPVVNSRTAISMQHLSENTYLLSVLKNDRLIKTFKIMKN